ncbi:MAG: hypothetical protein HY650_08875 [Acidobacteria bacterium]|nr:hypothetical protein [Acidobacteriota bacterium]
MSLFYELQDLYFDAMRLREELDRIPPRCDCHQAEAHLAGHCCCSNAQAARGTQEAAAGTGCQARLQKLREDVRRFAKDLRIEKQKLRPGEIPEDVERRIALIMNLIGYLGSTVETIESDLAEFRATCARDALLRMKARGKDLEEHITSLNRML